MKYCALFFILSFARCLQAQPGTLDPSFGTSGIVLQPIGNADDEANAVAIQPDGKIILAGYAEGTVDDNFALLRLKTDGTPDPSFSGDGKLTSTFGGGSSRANAVLVQPDGKILAAGYLTEGTDINFVVARYNPSGALDNSFGTGGRTATDVGGFFDKAYAMALQPNGKILVAGTLGKNTSSDFAVVRYKPNGTPDPSFGTNGIATLSIDTSYDEVRGIALQPDGKIVLAGYAAHGSDYDFALARLDSVGVPDPAFGAGGIVRTPIGISLDYARGLVLQPDGKIVVAGYTAEAANKYNFALARYLPDGSLDPAFNSTGIVTTAAGASYDEALSVALQPDGKIVAAGYSYTGNAPDVALARYLPDGALDPAFGAGGITITPVGAGSDQARALTLAPGGQWLVAGRSDNGTNLDFTALRYLSGLPLSASAGHAFAPEMRVSPNPVQASAVLEYSLTETQNIGLSLLDAAGNTVQSFFYDARRDAGVHRETLRLAPGLPAGHYWLLLKGQTGSRALLLEK